MLWIRLSSGPHVPAIVVLAVLLQPTHVSTHSPLTPTLTLNHHLLSLTHSTNQPNKTTFSFTEPHLNTRAAGCAGGSTAMPTQMLRSRMPSTSFWAITSHCRVSDESHIQVFYSSATRPSQALVHPLYYVPLPAEQLPTATAAATACCQWLE